MTNEEVLKLIEDGRIIPIQIKANDEETSKYNLENLEALNVIIKELKQEPCKDVISRQAVNALVDELARAISDERCFMSRGRSTTTIMQDILDLPSVTFQEPILDKIREEIKLLSNANPSYWHCGDMVEREEVFEIIDECMGKHISGGDTE